eukprot:3248042-Rhodomonas_salina.1
MTTSSWIEEDIGCLLAGRGPGVVGEASKRSKFSGPHLSSPPKQNDAILTYQARYFKRNVQKPKEVTITL